MFYRTKGKLKALPKMKKFKTKQPKFALSNQKKVKGFVSVAKLKGIQPKLALPYQKKIKGLTKDATF